MESKCGRGPGVEPRFVDSADGAVYNPRMETALLSVAVGLLITVAGAVAYLALQARKPPSADTGILLMQQQLDALRSQLAEALADSTGRIDQQLAQFAAQVNQQLGSVNLQLQSTTGQIGARLDQAARVVGEVRENLGALSQATQKVFDIGRDIASLQEILRAPKLRGILGELFLGDLLAQILPPTHFTLQHRFRSGEVVDAVIRIGGHLVPVDSKFPLENFRRVIDSGTDDERRGTRRRFLADLRKHVDAIADKYILPDEGTFPFALMYVPAENVYYEGIIRAEHALEDSGLLNHALSRRVIPVSPGSFYAYLQAIVLGLKGLQVERDAAAIIGHLERLRGDFDRFRKEFEILGTHLTNARGKYEDADRRLGRFGERLIAAGDHPAPAATAVPATDAPPPI